MSRDAQRAFVRGLQKAISVKCSRGQAFKFEDAFPEETFLVKLESFVSNMDECRLKKGQWDCYVFDDGHGDTVLLSLLGIERMPRKLKDGVCASLVHVQELAYGQEFRCLRVKCQITLSSV